MSEDSNYVPSVPEILAEDWLCTQGQHHSLLKVRQLLLEQRARLRVDPNNFSVFLQEESFLAGKLALIEELLSAGRLVSGNLSPEDAQ